MDVPAQYLAGHPSLETVAYLGQSKRRSAASLESEATGRICSLRETRIKGSRFLRILSQFVDGDDATR